MSKLFGIFKAIGPGIRVIAIHVAHGFEALVGTDEAWQFGKSAVARPQVRPR